MKDGGARLQAEVGFAGARIISEYTESSRKICVLVSAALPPEQVNSAPVKKQGAGTDPMRGTPFHQNSIESDLNYLPVGRIYIRSTP
jgi:hypothetical protein